MSEPTGQRARPTRRFHASPGRDRIDLPLLREGRTAQVFALTDERVLRRYRSPVSAEREAAVMDVVFKAGFPTPQVFRCDGPDLEMARIVGPTMLEALLDDPSQLDALAATLANLHERLHEIDAPSGTPLIGETGDRLLHLDLHPANVIMSSSGPVVIDWTSAARGEAVVDLAMTWVILRTAAVPVADPDGAAANSLRDEFLAAFVSAVPADFSSSIPWVAGLRLRDPHLTQAERAQVMPLAGR